MGQRYTIFQVTINKCGQNKASKSRLMGGFILRFLYRRLLHGVTVR
jgi:hypothetical protein